MSIGRLKRAAVWDMTRGQCWYCGYRLNPIRDFVVEHIVPICRGGTDDLWNLVPACRMCNSDKGKKTPEEWRAEFCSSEGLGPPDNPMCRFWFERDRSEPDFPQVWSHEKKTRRAWREHVIAA